MGKEFAFPAQARVKQQRDFDWSRNHSRRRSSERFVLFTCKREDPKIRRVRLGIVVTKKTGNAVVRNGWKRMIREVFRHQQKQLHQSLDYIVLVKKQVKEKASPQAAAEFTQLLLPKPTQKSKLQAEARP